MPTHNSYRYPLFHAVLQQKSNCILFCINERLQKLLTNKHLEFIEAAFLITSSSNIYIVRLDVKIIKTTKKAKKISPKLKKPLQEIMLRADKQQYNLIRANILSIVLQLCIHIIQVTKPVALNLPSSGTTSCIICQKSNNIAFSSNKNKFKQYMRIRVSSLDVRICLLQVIV